jgi:hypothetical protein
MADREPRGDGPPRGYSEPESRQESTRPDPKSRHSSLPGTVTEERRRETGQLSPGFWDIELSATKRLSIRWMARLGFSTKRRQYDLRVSTADSVLEIMNPRVLRLGLRFNF